MRRLLYAALLIALAAVVLPSDADAQISFGIGAGPSTAVGDFGDATNTGFHATGVMALRLPLLPISARGDVTYQRLPGVRDDDLQQFAGVVNGFFSLLPLPVLDAYVSGGVGLYHSSFGDDSSTDAGVNGGVGIRLNLLVLEPFAEVRYHHLLGSDKPRFVPVTIGVMF